MLSARIEDPHIQQSVTKNLKRHKATWRIIWLVILLLTISAGVYGYMRFAWYGREKVTVLLAEGQQHEGRLEFTAALKAYNNAMALEAIARPGAAQAAFKAANLNTRKSNHLEAQRLLTKAEKLDNSVAVYSLALGDSYLRTRTFDQAEQAFDRALEKSQDADYESAAAETAQAHVGLARIRLAEQDRDGASSRVTSALESNKDDLEAQVLKAVLVIHTDPSDSAELLSQAAKSTDAGIAATAKSLAVVADQIEASDDDSVSPAYERVEVGTALVEHNELDAALLELADATDRDEKYRDAWVNRAQAEVLLGKLDEAQTSIDTALKLDPTFGFSRYVAGQIAQARGNLEDAQKAYEQAIEQRTSDPQVYVALAQVLVARDDKTAAIEQLESAVSAEIVSRDVFDQLFWLLLENDQNEKALEVAEAYVAFDERGTTAQGLLAYAQLVNREEELARKTADELVVRDPLSAIGAYVLAVLDEDPVLFQKALDLDLGGRVAGMAKAALEGRDGSVCCAD